LPIAKYEIFLHLPKPVNPYSLFLFLHLPKPVNPYSLFLHTCRFADVRSALAISALLIVHLVKEKNDRWH
jgi:hypothetical protein